MRTDRRAAYEYLTGRAYARPMNRRQAAIVDAAMRQSARLRDSYLFSGRIDAACEEQTRITRELARAALTQ